MKLLRTRGGPLGVLLIALAVPSFAAVSAGLHSSVDAGLRFYDSIGIVKPAVEATVFDNNGNVNVAVAVSPPLRAGDRIALTLDARLVATLAGLRFELHGIDRGEHTLVAEAVDRDGNRLIASPPVIFNVWRASRLFPGRRAG